MKGTRYRILIGLIPLLIVVCRIIFWEELGTSIDEVAITLLIVSLIIILVPLENIKTFKAGGVEVELSQESVKAAINSFVQNIAENKILEEYTSSLTNEVRSLLRGSKVLWIDDVPSKIVGERRLFRSLGIEVVAASTSSQVSEIINRDNDFDLIISDIQWRDEENPQSVIYGGINAVKFLRTEYVDEVLNAVHVIFYTAYKSSQMDIIDSQTGFRKLNNHSECHTILSLLQTSVNEIIEARKEPISVSSRKKAT